MKNFYKILGLNRDAHVIEIRRAYRKQALALHPDVNKNSDAKTAFIEVNEAYSVLKHPISKISYDKLYDHKIAHESIKNETRYRNRESYRNENVNKKADKGDRNAERYAKQSDAQFERKTERSGFWDVLSGVFEFIGMILQFFV